MHNPSGLHIRAFSVTPCVTCNTRHHITFPTFRMKGNAKNAISEQVLPRFLDLIIWGHEHECLVDPQEVAGMGFHISQPGSSVATSLIEGEAKPKHVLLLEIKVGQGRVRWRGEGGQECNRSLLA